jgi:hypothetical protein
MENKWVGTGWIRWTCHEQKKKKSLIDPFLSFLHKYELKNVHNMCFMQDPHYKNLQLCVCSLAIIGAFSMFKNMIKNPYAQC